MLIDEHHQHLILLLNQLYEQIKTGNVPASVEKIIDELTDYATYHFAAEEHWMTVNIYPRLPEHSNEHERFCTWVAGVQKNFHNGKSNLGIEVLQFLNNWLTEHILKTDAEYARFAKGQL
jgi:hemerythrin